MSTKTMPQIPPRPSRSHDQPSSGVSSTLGGNLPKIPPRPVNRRIERSQSPHRDSFAPSPLNEPSFMASLGSLGNNGSLGGTPLYRVSSAEATSLELPRRPSSVVLPSIGQEGNEYDEVFGTPDVTEPTPTQTINVADDLQLHAPKPSLPVSSAKQRVSAVTRTDSNQAAAHGIGKASSSVDDKEPHSRALKSKSSIISQNSSGTERPSSADNDHGIPEIGQRVPMYPDAGDVQAPSPSPFATQFPPGIGFHNDGSKPRHHGRRQSGRGFEGPPGSYGLHGHGIVPENKFEKEYYQKHPDLLKKETGLYGGVGEGRGEWALSSDDLNKIVRDTASRGSGLGGEVSIMAPPDEQIGFLASEEYASRMSSPRPHSGYYKLSNASQTHVDSPLRKQSISADPVDKSEFEHAIGGGLRQGSDVAPESEDDDVVHVDALDSRIHQVYGVVGDVESSEHLATSSHGEEGLLFEDRGYSAPILASDEVAKEPFGYDLQPAVSPVELRRTSELYHHRNGSGTSSAHASQPSSRPTSIYGVSGIRYQHDLERESHSTPLEDLEEYEPLFPEDEKKGSIKGKPLTAADKLKRPELTGRKFPSQDIWEDSPNSLHYTATVSTPQLPEDGVVQDEKKKGLHVQEGETPGQAFARRQEELAEEEAQNSDSFLNRETKPWAHKSLLTEGLRQSSKQRFPSKDIWEDSPDSLMLQTTVATPQEEDKELMSPEEKLASKPQIPARPIKQKPSNISASSSPTDTTKAPPLPAKSKPQIPARPSKPISRESSENVALAKVTSASSTKSAGSDSGVAASKPKPPVPSRPVGSKIAALQGGFMSDLNKRLQLGPQAPKKEEPAPEDAVEDKEKVPLVDARKGRAQGPARRAPAKRPTPATEESKPAFPLSISQPLTLWSIDPETDIIETISSKTSVPEIKAAAPVVAATPEAAKEVIHEEEHASTADDEAVGQDDTPASTGNAGPKPKFEIAPETVDEESSTSTKEEIAKSEDDELVATEPAVAEEEKEKQTQTQTQIETEKVE